jgi:hypothetical protein
MEEPTVKFTRRVKNNSMFIWPETDDIYKAETDDIVTFLPEPVKSRRDGIL